MASITIRNFSCIDAAEVHLGKLTLIIGPQASGKSVISKLIHYFYDTLSSVVSTWEPEDTFDGFTDAALERFRKAFPPSAWGLASFQVSFSAGPVTITISRAKPRKTNSGKLRILFSGNIRDEFDKLRAEVSAAVTKSAPSDGESSLSRKWELTWQVEREARQRMEKLMGADFTSSQLFIPAGRSFFTNMGKAILAFEQGGFLDPLTVRFGKQFMTFREDDDQRILWRSHDTPKVLAATRDKLAKSLFSGDITFERNDAYVQADDGRKIPFAVLSSGQQELLPLWLTLNGFIDAAPNRSLIYIEEPEAHLFPSAQGQIASYLAEMLTANQSARMLITTHSPYMLSVFNNLLKAGSLSREVNKKLLHEIEKVIPRSQWLMSEDTTAYAIVDREVHPIIDSDGLIDGEYLDKVSGAIGGDFMGLLEIESAQ